MAISIDTTTSGTSKDNFNKAPSVTDGNEVIFKLSTSLKTTIHVVTSDATYQLMLSAMGDTPTDFTGFAAYSATDLTGTKLIQLEAGLSYIGVDVSSGTCAVYVRQTNA